MLRLQKKRFWHIAENVSASKKNWAYQNHFFPRRLKHKKCHFVCAIVQRDPKSLKKRLRTCGFQKEIRRMPICRSKNLSLKQKRKRKETKLSINLSYYPSKKMLGGENFICYTNKSYNMQRESEMQKKIKQKISLHFPLTFGCIQFVCPCVKMDECGFGA